MSNTVALNCSVEYYFLLLTFYIGVIFFFFFFFLLECSGSGQFPVPPVNDEYWTSIGVQIIRDVTNAGWPHFFKVEFDGVQGEGVGA